MSVASLRRSTSSSSSSISSSLSIPPRPRREFLPWSASGLGGPRGGGGVCGGGPTDLLRPRRGEFPIRPAPLRLPRASSTSSISSTSSSAGSSEKTKSSSLSLGTNFSARSLRVLSSRISRISSGCCSTADWLPAAISGSTSSKMASKTPGVSSDRSGSSNNDSRRDPCRGSDRLLTPASNTSFLARSASWFFVRASGSMVRGPLVPVLRGRLRNRRGGADRLDVDFRNLRSCLGFRFGFWFRLGFRSDLNPQCACQFTPMIRLGLRRLTGRHGFRSRFGRYADLDPRGLDTLPRPRSSAPARKPVPPSVLP